VFQQFHLIPYLSVRENVLAARIGSGDSTRNGSDRVNELLNELGLFERRTHRPGQLSTGERQRTALARALYNSPKLLLADEPTGNLDAENAEAVLGRLRQFASSGGMVLLVTHDARAASFADTIWDMANGSILGLNR
jgi:ABC-type lipoprotein export system ATPase subunit